MSNADYQKQILKGLHELELDTSSATVTSERISLKLRDLSVEQKVVIEWSERRLLLIRNLAPFNIPEMARGPVAEVLVRANWGLSTGNFEIDLSDGEVRFKASAFYHEMPNITPIFKYHMQACIQSFQEVVSKLQALAV